MDKGDKTLLHDVRAGREDAMKALYETYVGYLRGVCSRYIPDADLVQDVLQESFISIFTSIGQFEYRGEGSLRAWMKRIVIHQSLNLLRKYSTMVTLDESYGIEVEEDDDADPGAEDLSLTELQKMIQELPTGYRTVFNLYVLEDLSHKEIAGMLGISEGTSASQYSRARKMLAKKIVDYRESRR